MAMGYDPDSTTLVADDGVLYYVQATGNSWFLNPYRDEGSVANLEATKISQKGIEALNASPPNTGTSATGYDITPPVDGTYAQHQLTSQLL